MSPAQFPDNSPHIVNGVYEVASHHVGKGLLDIIRDRFTDGKIRSGHYYFNRTRSMIQQHYPGLPLKDQNTIHFEFVKMLGVQEELESAQGNVFKKYARARKYKRISKDTFKIVEHASNRSVNNNLVDQLSEALGGRPTQPPGSSPAGPQPPQTGTTSTHSNPFSDSHAEPTLTEIDVGNLNEVELSTFASEATGEAAAIIGLHRRDGTTQEVVTTFPFEPREGYMADEGAETRTVASFDTSGCAMMGSHSEAGDDAGR